ncbi:MAG: hypothetical protein IJU76_01745 [Desulfovibrionaceae bacterium]|nr:hypothetical protein [Desulfovibrionaceae bacterium]
MTEQEIWHILVSPLCKLLCGLTVGILIANLLEALHWSRFLASFSRPFARIAHFGHSAQTAFTLAFFSSHAANANLSQAYQKGLISRRELFLASLFTSFPAYLTHLPTLFFLIFPVLGFATLTYISLALLAALLRTLAVLVLARKLLPGSLGEPEAQGCERKTFSLRSVLSKVISRTLARLPGLLCATIPVYLLVFYAQEQGWFETLRLWLADQPFWIASLSPKAAGIVVLQLFAELGLALGAAASLLALSGISHEEVICALLIGNILSTPLRALRHQFPSYAGYFGPLLGMHLVLVNQSFRFFFMLLVTAGYLYWIR